MTPVQHPWQLDEDEQADVVEWRAWPVVSQDLYVGVPSELIPNAEALLLEEKFVELSPVHVRLGQRQELAALPEG